MARMLGNAATSTSATTTTSRRETATAVTTTPSKQTVRSNGVGLVGGGAVLRSPLRPRSLSRDEKTNNSSSLFHHGNNHDSILFNQHHHAASVTSTAANTSPRRRINSRDIPRTYSGLYGASDDLLPFELNRRSIVSGSSGIQKSTVWWCVFISYVLILAAVQAMSMMIVSYAVSWTVTNAIHLLVTIITIHWLKGSMCDEQGEMNALTLWEQLDASADARPVRRLLLTLPTAGTYAACHFCHYDPLLCAVNVILWAIAMLAKLPFMHGVRLFGINRTVGIDDDDDDHAEDVGVIAASGAEGDNKKTNKKKQ